LEVFNEDHDQAIGFAEYQKYKEKYVMKLERRNNFITNISNAIYHNSKGKIKKLADKIDIAFTDKLFLIIPTMETRTIKFYGINVNVPKDTERHIQLYYGSNWRSKESNWKKYKYAPLEFLKYSKLGIKVCEI
jgi:hypothetical protein